MSTHDEKRKSLQAFDEIAESVLAEWHRIARQPDVLTDLSEQQVVFAAGGGLVAEFGDETSEVWQAIRRQFTAKRNTVEIAGRSATRQQLEALFGNETSEIWQAVRNQGGEQEDTIEIAGVLFARQELEALGRYYRWLKKQKGFTFHCIDERLEDDEKHLEKEVHVGCGACAAVGAATDLADVETMLLARSNMDEKQKIYADMPRHRSMTILIDFNGADVVLGDERERLRALGSLPFNVSLPTALIREYLDHSEIDRTSLLAALVKWSVQIARNIIGGDQNELRPVADRTLLVLDKRGIKEDNPLAVDLINLVSAVEHGETIEIQAVS